MNRDLLKSVLGHMQDEEEFLPPCGIRAISRYHQDHSNVVTVMGHEYHGTYEPTQSGTGLFGGNSNWRGPIWFPVNYLLVESLQKFHYFLGGQYYYKEKYTAGSGRQSTLWQVTTEISRRLTHIFLQKMPRGNARCSEERTDFRTIRIGATTYCSENTSTETTGQVSARVTERAGQGWCRN